MILPQALRIAMPGVTNDFISLLKDSSLVSVLTVVELTKRMTIVAVDNRGWLLPGALCAALYFLLGYPFARLARRLERRRGSAPPSTPDSGWPVAVSRSRTGCRDYRSSATGGGAAA